MNLRPHHLLCIQKFAGYGYNEAFTAHMNAIVSELLENPDTPIIVVQGCDSICKKCPENVIGICALPEKVDVMDQSVLRLCDLAYGENVSWTKAANEARKRILETEEFKHICSCCQWFELCGSTEVDCE